MDYKTQIRFRIDLLKDQIAVFPEREGQIRKRIAELDEKYLEAVRWDMGLAEVTARG